MEGHPIEFRKKKMPNYRLTKKIIIIIVFMMVATLTQGESLLKVGDTAPDFRLIGSDGQYYTLNQFKFSKPVVIAFFPFAFTGG